MAGNLTAQKINELMTEAQKHGKTVTTPDSANLYLQIAPTGASECAASWLFRYQLRGRRRWMGLGPYPTVSASKARTERDTLRKQVKAGIDPLESREASKAAAVAQATAQKRDAITFRQCAEEFMDAKDAGWRNPKHRDQWRNTLKTYAYPIIGEKSLSQIETADVLTILHPIWVEKTETASRVRGRIESVLDYAKAHGLREGENPARWKGHLSHTLPTPSKVAKVEHQRALPHAEAPALAKALADMNTTAARATLLTLHCATRTGETLGATWAEIDLDSKLWTIPADRMKAGKTHRIPLTSAAVALLEQQKAHRRDDWVFPGQRLGKPLSNMAMTNALKRAGWLERTTVHGLRSTFRDWIADRTQYPDRLAEVALAHQLTDKVQAAYNRSDMMERRRAMMEDWTKYLEKKPGKVVELPTGKRA